MNISEHNGESSSKGREDGAAATGSERPLKKARFAWQVKGKYHLKNETDKCDKNRNMSSTDTDSSASSSQPSIDAQRSDVGNCIIKQNCNQLVSVRKPDSIIISQENSMTTSLSFDKMQYPRYLSSFERMAMNNSSMLGSNSSSNVRSVPMTDTAEDQCIAHWQARQVVKSCLDNSLNSVLESWTTEPLPGDEASSRFIALNFAEFINHLPGDNSVENEGILMAISAHGLRSITRSSDADFIDNFNSSSTSAFNIPSPLPSMSLMITDEDIQQEEINYDEKLPSKIQDWQCDTENTSAATPFAYFSEPSQSPYEFYDDNNQNSNTESLDIESDYDIMNAAVLFAIKSKGLTASGTEYG